MATVRTFHKWKQGSSGSGDAAQTEYNSENAQVYENGTLGPRPGWKAISDTAGAKVWDPTADSIEGLTWYRETDDAEVLALVFDDAGTQKYDTLPLASPTWVAGGSINNNADTTSLHPPEYDDRQKQPVWNDGFLVTALGGYLAIATSTTIGTPAAINTTNGYAAGVTIYRERAYYWGFAAQPGRVYYSEPADYTNVGATSSFDVNIKSDTYAGAITGMWAVKNALVIVRSDDRWHVMTGVTPESGSMRELGRDIVPDFVSAAVVDNQIYFLNRTGSGVVVATPSFVESEQLEYLSPTAYPGSTEFRPDNSFLPQTAVGDEVGRSLFLPGRKSSNNQTLVAVERTNGVFNLSRWIHSGSLDDIVFTRGRPGEMYCAADAGTSWAIYSRNHTLNRPANSGDSKSVSLDNEAGTASGSEVVVDLGEIVSGAGKIIRPVKVVLDIDYWKGGNYSAPELAVDATIKGVVGEGATPEDILSQQTETTTSWDNTSGDLPYKRRVPVILPQGQYGTRFRIRLTYDNLALESVQVYYEEQKDPR